VIYLALIPLVFLGVILLIIGWTLIAVALIGLFNWNLVLGFLVAIALSAGAYHWWYDPDET